MPVNETPTLPGLTCGQRRDRRTGEVQPWYTHPALDVIETWDLAGKVVLEWGGGYSTLWWASRAAHVFTIEGATEWGDLIRAGGARNVTIIDKTPGGADIRTAPDAYARIPDGCAADIVVIDDNFRTACLKSALTLPRPFVLIVDNWQQDYVYRDAEAEALMAPIPGRFFVQADHRDHEGRPWQTAIWEVR